MSGEAVRLAQDLLGADWESAVQSCRDDPVLAESVSRVAAQLLRDRAREVPIPRAPEDLVWTVAQLSFPTLASVSGADQVSLAESLFFALTRQSPVGEETLRAPLREEALRWLLQTVPTRIERLVDRVENSFDEFPFEAETHFVFAAIWVLPGEAGARWFVRLIHSDDIYVGFRYQEMGVGQIPGWVTDDWNRRLDAICDACDERPGFLSYFSIGHPPGRLGRSSGEGGVHVRVGTDRRAVAGSRREHPRLQVGSPGERRRAVLVGRRGAPCGEPALGARAVQSDGAPRRGDRRGAGGWPYRRDAGRLPRRIARQACMGRRGGSVGSVGDRGRGRR